LKGGGLTSCKRDKKGAERLLGRCAESGAGGSDEHRRVKGLDIQTNVASRGYIGEPAVLSKSV